MLPIPPEEDQDHIDIGIMDAGGGGNVNNNNQNNINVIKDYDTKWNEGEEEKDDIDEEESPVDYPDIVEKQMPSTMVLVIGIIVGAFVAMILIVIIVLKIRVRVDQPKCEEAAPRYQFAPPNDYGEVGGEQETATTSLMEGSVAPPLVSLPPTASANAAANAGAPVGGLPAGVPPGGVGGPAALSGVGAGLYNNGMFTNNNCASRPLQPPPPSSNGDRSRLFRKSNGSKPVREWYV